VALGFTIVYAATGAINFAQGEFFMLGGMLGAFFAGLGLPLPLARVGGLCPPPPPSAHSSNWWPSARS